MTVVKPDATECHAAQPPIKSAGMRLAEIMKALNSPGPRMAHTGSAHSLHDPPFLIAVCQQADIPGLEAVYTFSVHQCHCHASLSGTLSLASQV